MEKKNGEKKWKTKNEFKKMNKKMEKKVPSRHKYCHPAATQETNFFLRVASRVPRH